MSKSKPSRESIRESTEGVYHKIRMFVDEKIIVQPDNLDGTVGEILNKWNNLSQTLQWVPTSWINQNQTIQSSKL